MNREKEAEMDAKTLEHDIRNQLSNIYLAVEGIKSEFKENDNEDFVSYTNIIISCCKQVESIINKVNLNR